MKLTPDQRARRAEGTRAERTAMELLVTLGEVYGADSLIPITSAHVSGASYKIVGEAGLAFLEDFAETARVRVRTTVNPVGMDLQAWSEIGIPETYAARQRRIVEAYRRMGVEETWSCIPYQVGNRPTQGEHVAWAESSAAIFANAVLGARTNREGGPSALAAGITGWTPDYGLHREQARQPTVVISVGREIHGYEYALLGHHLGERLPGGVPYLRGPPPREDELKAFGAALATSSDITMYHWEGTTPEAAKVRTDGLEAEIVTQEDLEETRSGLMTAPGYDLVAFGCPQLSGAELEEVAELMAASRPTTPVWAFTSRAVAEAFPQPVARIRELGGRVLLDTCPEVMPLDRIARDVGSPSAKAAVYLPALSGQRVYLDDPTALVRRKR